MTYTNKTSAKRKHRKYRRRTKKGGVVMFVRKPVNSPAIRRNETANTEIDEAEAVRGVAVDYTRAALDDALSIFSRQEQAQAPSIGVTVHGKSRAKREGPTPGQIKKAEQKALKEQEKALKKELKKELKEQEKAEKEQNKLHTKVAKDVTKSAIDVAFSSMFGKGTGPKSRRRRK